MSVHACVSARVRVCTYVSVHACVSANVHVCVHAREYGGASGDLRKNILIKCHYYV